MATEQTLESEVAKFAERWVGRWNAHDIEGTLALVTDDITWEDPSIEGTARGLLDARRYIERTARRSARSTRRASRRPGRRSRLGGFDVWELRRSDGCRRRVSHNDALELARRVGLMPARGSGTERMLVRPQRPQARFARPRLV